MRRRASASPTPSRWPTPSGATPATRRWCAAAAWRTRRCASTTSPSRPREPLPRGVHGLGGARALGLDGRRERLHARHLRRAAAPDDRPPGRRARSTLLGSSMGGSAAIELAAHHPKMIDRLILNDIGPYIPKRRRKRRAQTLARHYVFRDPSDLLRKIGASQKNDGPISDDIRFNVTFHQTQLVRRGGRARLPPRRARAAGLSAPTRSESLGQWRLWERVRCPVLLIHGLLSDALLRPHHPAHAPLPRGIRDARAGHGAHAGALRPQPELVHPPMARATGRRWAANGPSCTPSCATRPRRRPACRTPWSPALRLVLPGARRRVRRRAPARAGAARRS